MPADLPQRHEGRPTIARAALFGLCPQCGARTLFDGWLRFAPRCRGCGLDFDSFNVGDGAAALVILLISAIIVPGALGLHFGLHPPLLVELLLWPIIATALTIWLLRVAKGALITAEFQRDAREGRLASHRAGPPDQPGGR